MLLVTGFFDLYIRENNNIYKRDSKTYIDNFINLTSIIKNYKIIVYLDNTLISYNNILSKIKNVEIKYISINNLPLYKYLKKIYECNLCQPYFNINKYTPLYSIIVNSKFYLLKLAIEEYKNESCFSWIDFGCMYYNYLRKYFNENDIEPTIKYKIQLCIKDELYSNDKNIEYYFNNTPKVSGVFFSGYSEQLLDLYNFVNKIYLYFINTKRLIFEEHILGYYASINYNNCQIIFGSNFEALLNIKKIKNNNSDTYIIFLKTFRNRNNRDPEINEIPEGLKHLTFMNNFKY